MLYCTVHNLAYCVELLVRCGAASQLQSHCSARTSNIGFAPGRLYPVSVPVIIIDKRLRHPGLPALPVPTDLGNGRELWLLQWIFTDPVAWEWFPIVAGTLLWVKRPHRRVCQIVCSRRTNALLSAPKKCDLLWLSSTVYPVGNG